MWARRMIPVMLIGLLLGLSLGNGLAVANEQVPAKPEPAPVKPESVPAKPVPTSVKPRSAGNDTKPAEKMRHPTKGSPASKATALPPPPAAIFGQDGAPMVLGARRGVHDGERAGR